MGLTSSQRFGGAPGRRARRPVVRSEFTNVGSTRRIASKVGKQLKTVFNIGQLGHSPRPWPTTYLSPSLAGLVPERLRTCGNSHRAGIGCL
jgi:hypothetical protein